MFHSLCSKVTRSSLVNQHGLLHHAKSHQFTFSSTTSTNRLLSFISSYNKQTYRYYRIDGHSIFQQLGYLVESACRKVYPDIKITEDMLGIHESRFADYQTNIGFTLSKIVGGNPKSIVEKLAGTITELDASTNKVLKEVKQSGAGFLMFELSNSFIANQAVHKKAIIIKNNTGQSQSTHFKQRRVIIDHGSPNMSKEFHVGHLRSIMIGDCLARVLKYQGHDVETVSHVGDFGTPMALVVSWAIIDKKPWASFPTDPSVPLPSPEQLSNLYTEAVQAKKNRHPQLLEMTSRVVKTIQNRSNPVICHVYDTICKASRIGFDEVYKALDVTIPEKGESWYAKFIPDVIKELEQKKVLTLSEGAKVVQLSDWDAPLLVEKSDSTWLYGTTDLACLKYRTAMEKYDEVLYVVDFTQSQHFQQVFAVGRMMEWYDPAKTRVEHVAFGVVQGMNGQKLSSRDGSPMTLRQLLAESVTETKQALVTARSILRSVREDQDVEPESLQEILAEPKRHGDLETTASPTTIALAEENAPKVAYNAVKFFELAQARNQNYIFSFQAMLALRGHTSFYIIYAYARIAAIFRNAESRGVVADLCNDESELLPQEQLSHITKQERALCLALLSFPDAIRSVEVHLTPHLLSTHVIHIAQAFHSFYENCRVFDSVNQQFRLRLCKATMESLSIGLDLLNVQSVSKV